MSERPPGKSETTGSESQSTGGWRTPQTPGTWRAPEKTSGGGWSSVPALPDNLEEAPAATGEWHLPRPDDTPFSPEDTLPVNPDAAPLLPGIEGAAPFAAGGQATNAAPAAPAVPLSATRSPATPEDELLAIVTSASEEAARQRQADKPKDLDGPPEDVLFMLEKLEDEGNDDYDTFSMSELVALASLVDEEPRTTVTPGASAPLVAPVLPPPGKEDSKEVPVSGLTPAEKAVLGQTQASSPTGSVPAVDPGDYARQQLAALGGDDGAGTGGINPATASPTITQPGVPGGADPGEYARQQLAALGGDGGTGVGAGFALPPINTQVDPRQEELARRFREVEDEVHSLRQMLQYGQISQEQFEDQLRSLMILDDDQVWWMIGAETDTWYKFVNNEWLVSEPPRTGTGGFSYINEPLPTLDSQPQPAYNYGDTAGIAGSAASDDPYAPFPRSGIPTVDPNLTQVGRSYLDNEISSPGSTATVANAGYGGQATVASPTLSGATVPSAASAYGGYGGIESPVDTSQPPAFGELDPEAPTYEEAAERARSNTLRNVVLAGLALVAVAAVIVVGGLFFILQWYNNIVSEYEVPINNLASYQPEFQTVTIQDYEGRVLARLSQSGEERISVDINDVSPFLIHAIVAVENERFFEDPGWDFVAIVRAFFQNLNAGTIESGASTITQQVARALVIRDSDVSAARKLDEVVVAGELTRQYDKEFLLELYLNEFFFGNQAYGVEAASQFYFEKSAADLNLPEAAMLAGILQNPLEYDPVTNPESAFARMEFVLQRMAEVGCLTFTDGQQVCVTQADITGPQTIFDKARVRDPRRYRPREFETRYPHFIRLVQQQLENAFTANVLYSSGFTVRTTLVPALQDRVQTRLTEQIRALTPNGVTTGAVMITNPATGAIRAYIGSPDFNSEANKGQIDYARVYRQPGSTIKPILYAAALEGVDKNGNGSATEQGEFYTPASIIWDVPTVYTTTPPYEPRNLSGTFYGPVALRTALQGSYNVSAVKVYEFVGQQAFVDTAQDMGIRWAENAAFGLPSALGATEVRLYDMMVAYGTIANDGTRVPIFTVESITDRDGNEVRIPESLHAPQTPNAIPNTVAYLLQDILSDDAARAASGAFTAGGPLTLQNLDRNDWVGAKTGTSDLGDLWTMGFLSNAVVGVWLGHPDNAPIRDATGITAAAPLWNQIMTDVYNASQPRPQAFTPVEGIITLQVCPDTGAVTGGTCASPLRTEVFDQTRRPLDSAQGFITQATVDTWTGLLWRDTCGQSEDRENRVFVNINDIAAINWLNTTQGQAVARRLGLPQVIEQVPTLACDSVIEHPTVNIAQPTPNQQLVGSVQIIGQVAAPANFSRYQLEYAPVGSQNYQLIGSFSTVQQAAPNSLLGTWDTTTVPNGQYILRLAVIATDGGYVYRTVIVTVNNPLPTATPPPTATTAPPVATLPPLPFDAVTPTIDTSGN